MATIPTCCELERFQEVLDEVDVLEFRDDAIEEVDRVLCQGKDTLEGKLNAGVKVPLKGKMSKIE